MSLYFVIVVLRLLIVDSNKIEPKVVFGNRTKIQHHPYLAFIVITEDKYAYICGSSIINQRVLLTAAHCFDELTRKSKGTATVGHTNKEKGFIIKLSKVKIHPKYNTITITTDIALAGLERDIRFGTSINRLALARRRPSKGTALIAGWGLLSEEPYRDTDLLHETEQNIWPRDDCIKLLKKIPPGTFCGGKPRNGGYPSMGDSGSPLVINKYFQVGLVSFKKMHISRSVIIYTDVPYYYKWIVENTRSVFCA